MSNTFSESLDLASNVKPEDRSNIMIFWYLENSSKCSPTATLSKMAYEVGSAEIQLTKASLSKVSPMEVLINMELGFLFLNSSSVSTIEFFGK